MKPMEIDEIEVTVEMEKAGLETMREVNPLVDPGYFVRALYRAMEYQRREADNGKKPVDME